MASEEHKRLSAIVKEHHDNLRQLSKIYGSSNAWDDHHKNNAQMQSYSTAMRQLAYIWEDNSLNPDLMAQSRISWIIEYCHTYFYKEKIYLKKRLRELRLMESYGFDTNEVELMDEISDTINALDVGSCFNPFGNVPYLNVTAIDLCPASTDVYQGDFLKIPVSDDKSLCINDHAILSLPREYFHCVIFSLVLDYIPSSEQRLVCCRKAFEILKPEGILIIVTPDSQHVGKNAKLMKNWQFTFATLGYLRICFQKLPHITCMVFRKTINSNISYRWAKLHFSESMNVAIPIPQDKNSNDDSEET